MRNCLTLVRKLRERKEIEWELIKYTRGNFVLLTGERNKLKRDLILIKIFFNFLQMKIFVLKAGLAVENNAFNYNLFLVEFLNPLQNANV